MLAAVFIAGWTGQAVVDPIQELGQPSGDGNPTLPASIMPPFIVAEPAERPSPHDWIGEDQIHVYDSRIVIDVQGAEWASFTDTNSMDPVIDSGSNAIELVPERPDQIHIGDIVSYASLYSQGTIIHRVVEIGSDEQGWYCRMKGDNIDSPDPGKVRFSQIRRVVVGILY